MTGAGSAGSTPLGILAGGSAVPIEIAAAVSARGRPVHIVGIAGEAEAGIDRFPHTWVNLGGVGAMIAAFRGHGCRDIVIVGRVRRPNLARLRPDLGFWASLPALLGFLRGGDDAILRIVVGFFESQGMRVVGAHEAAPELLAGAGALGSRVPSAAHLGALATAAAALAALGPFDAAQAAVAGPAGLIAVEGADGTDAMLRRLATGGGPGRRLDARGAILVKIPKPDQERRIDLPAIGPDTVSRAAEAGLAGVAVRSGGTLVAERNRTIRLADEAGLFVFGAEEIQLSATAGDHDTGEGVARLAGLKPVGVRSAKAAALADANLAARVIDALEPWWPRASAVVSRGYVLGSESAGGAVGLAERAGAVKPWGSRWLRRQVGVLAMASIDGGETGPDPARLVERAKASGLVGLVILRAPADEPALAALATASDAAGLFLLAPGRSL